MLEVHISASEFFNEETEEFIDVSEVTLQLEHSLFSIAIWEAKWEKPFLGKDERSYEESIDYIRCMTLNKESIDPMTYTCISSRDSARISDYIQAKMSATWFNDRNEKKSNQIITAEVVYSWMVAAKIPFECDRWHFNRLLTLIKVCNLRENSGKKMSKREILSQNRAINAARRQSLGTSG